jgi:type II restriction enzyme
LEAYQLKGQKHLNLGRIVDGAFASMSAAVKQNAAPNLLILNYSSDWMVRNLILVPSLFFTASVIEQRKPLGPLARRAGWIGCNLALDNVPSEGKIALVRDAIVVNPASVRESYRRVRTLRSLDWELRGWTLDVLRVAHSIGTSEFTLEQAYRYEQELLRLHPKNRNVRPKIRQQLQILRDLKLLEFLGGGRYRLISPERAAEV